MKLKVALARQHLWQFLGVLLGAGSGAALGLAASTPHTKAEVRLAKAAENHRDVTHTVRATRPFEIVFEMDESTSAYETPALRIVVKNGLKTSANFALGYQVADAHGAELVPYAPLPDMSLTGEASRAESVVLPSKELDGTFRITVFAAGTEEEVDTLMTFEQFYRTKNGVSQLLQANDYYSDLESRRAE